MRQTPASKVDDIRIAILLQELVDTGKPFVLSHEDDEEFDGGLYVGSIGRLHCTYPTLLGLLEDLSKQVAKEEAKAKGTKGKTKRKAD